MRVCVIQLLCRRFSVCVMMSDLSRREPYAARVFVIPLNPIHDETLVGFSLMHSANVTGVW